MTVKYRWIICACIVAITIGITGCSTTKTLDPNYEAYRQTLLTQKPLVTIEWSEDGAKLKRLEVNPQLQVQQRQPDPAHPAWRVADSLVRGATVVGGIWAAGDALKGLAGSVQGNTNVVAGGHIAGGGISIPTTTTTNTTTSTETITNPVDTGPPQP
ncbi:hypothetical protein [Desulfatirhabdium butyrativorans]|uniref:hypothetical protein n=1 Tax=Desulfatirhabdium butyrativorans TaxID=340467 RepID=UPI000422A29A|nr:hypothetical protein [Desulfatirhabdium butyrativorans]